MVVGDADMIRQATANLISNAVRYTPEGGHTTVLWVKRRRATSWPLIAVRRHRRRPAQRRLAWVFLALLAAPMQSRNRESGGWAPGA
ncbi:MAG: hypothetical protein ACLTDR_03405 [Adlercreutzia equolifaciens]